MTIDSSRPITIMCKWQAETVASFIGRSVQLVVVLDDFDLTVLRPDQALLDRCAQVYRVRSVDSLAEMAEVASDLAVQGAQVQRIVSLNEFGQYGAGYLNLLLGSGAADPLAHAAVRDKRLMKQRVQARGVRVPRWHSIPDIADRAAVEAVADRVRFPVVLKPAAGFGTMSTVRIDDRAAFLDLLPRFEYEDSLLSRQLIVEEFVEGDEFHVDALWVDGVCQYLTIAAYQQPRLETITRREVPEGPSDGSLVLSPEQRPELYAEVRKLHAEVNAALAVRSCATHLEIFVDRAGEIWFSEIATRVSGGWGPLLLTHWLGRDVWDVIAEGLTTGAAQVPVGSRPTCVGVVHLAPAHEGRIIRMPDDGVLSAFPGVLGWRRLKNVGDQARFTHAADWYLFVVLGADSESEYRKLAADLAGQLPIVTEPEPEPGTEAQAQTGTEAGRESQTGAADRAAP